MSAVELKRADVYQFANNDYGSLLKRLAKGETTNLIVTDGVQSDPESKAQLSGVLTSIDQWVRSGGTFATFLYRTPYSGQYYSDLPGADPKYSCSDRPLTVFALGRSPSAVDDLLERFGSDLRPDHLVRLGGNSLPVTPVERTLADADRGRGTRVLRSSEQLILDRFSQVFRSAVAPGSAGPNGFVPLQFGATVSRSAFPWRALAPDEIRTFLRNLEANVQAFSLTPSEIERINSAQQRTRKASVIPQGASQDSTSLLRPVDIQTREMSDPTVNVEDDSVQVRFTVPVRRPSTDKRTSHFALLVRFGVTPTASRMLIPDSYSTDNDLNPANCDKIYKLQQLVGTIMHRNYAPGQALMITEWR
jgi:hypothetical protein